MGERHGDLLQRVSPWLTLQEAGVRLRFKSRKGIYAWLARHPEVQKSRRGKVWLVAVRDIDAAVEPSIRLASEVNRSVRRVG